MTFICVLTYIIKYSQGFRKAFSLALSCSLRSNTGTTNTNTERTTQQLEAKF